MPVLEPNSKRDYGFDYATELGTDTIATSTWTADTGLTLSAMTNSTTATTAWIEVGAEDGKTLTATNRIVTAAGRTYERVLTLLIRSAVDETDDYRIIAADMIAKYAPPPTVVAPATVPAEYYARAARAERLLVNYLTQTGGGVVAGKSLSGLGSFSYSAEALKTVRSIISGAMGGYYTAGRLRSVGIISSFPR